MKKGSVERGLAVRPLTPAIWPALMELFQEGGAPSWCWCAFYRTRGSEADRIHREENRALLRRLAACRTLAPGLVALRGGRAVGWVSLGPRADFPLETTGRVVAAEAWNGTLGMFEREGFRVVTRRRT